VQLASSTFERSRKRLTEHPFCGDHLHILGTFVDCPYEAPKLAKHSGSIDLEICRGIVRTFAGLRAFVFYETLRCVSFSLGPAGLGARDWRSVSVLRWQCASQAAKELAPQ
jgi:hypothetical protein